MTHCHNLGQDEASPKDASGVRFKTSTGPAGFRLTWFSESIIETGFDFIQSAQSTLSIHIIPSIFLHIVLPS